MKSQNQILMIALAIVFAIALALTVAMICLAAMQREEQETDPFPSLPVYPDSYSASTPPTVIQTTEQLTSPPDTGSGLVFRSTGYGTCTLEGIGSCRDAFVVIPEYSPAGDLVTAVSDRALMGCQTVTAVQIPETVTEIGYLAFAGCPNLIYISVSERSTSYCDREGVLYSADGKTLIAYPALRAGSSLYISASVSRIEDMAFYRCTYLTAIRYAGSAEQWESIAIGNKNYSLTAAAIVYNAEFER